MKKTIKIISIIILVILLLFLINFVRNWIIISNIEKNILKNYYCKISTESKENFMDIFQKDNKLKFVYSPSNTEEQLTIIVDRNENTAYQITNGIVTEFPTSDPIANQDEQLKIFTNLSMSEKIKLCTSFISTKDGKYSIIYNDYTYIINKDSYLFEQKTSNTNNTENYTYSFELDTVKDDEFFVNLEK